MLLAAMFAGGCQGADDCTAAGGISGIRLQAAPALEARVSSGEVRRCQAGSCETLPVDTSSPSDIARGFENQVWGPTDPGLRPGPAEVTLVLRDVQGRELANGTVTAEAGYVNGRGCGVTHVEATVNVAEDGEITA